MSAADGVALHAARVGGGFEHPAFGGRFAGAAREALGCTPPSPNVKYFYRESPHRPRSRMSEAASRKKIAAPWSRPASTSAVIGAIWSHPEGPRAAVAEFNEVFVAISSSLARARAGAWAATGEREPDQWTRAAMERNRVEWVWFPCNPRTDHRCNCICRSVE